MAIRNAAKAIILHNKKILLNKNSYPMKGIYYGLPGGGQNQYETLEEAVKRECLEETGYEIVPKRLLALYEEIIQNDDFREKHPDYSHKIYFVFLCYLKNETHEKPKEKDQGQIASVWIDLENIQSLNILPKAIKENIPYLLEDTSIKFLGSDNVNFNL